MASNVNFLWILFMGVLAILADGVAAAMALTAPSPLPSLNATNTVPQDMLLEWMKITAVPLGVFLMGACTWGCIKHSVIWRSLTGRRGESNASVEQVIDSNRHASDVEGELELSKIRIDEDLAAMSAQALKVQHSPLGFQNDEEKSAASDAALAQL